MVNKSGRLGAGWEAAVVKYLQANGFPFAERRAKTGAKDKGDITGVNPYLVVECKNEARIDLAGYMAEVEAETANADALIGVAWVKRRNKGIDRSYIVMEPGIFLRLLKAWIERGKK